MEDTNIVKSINPIETATEIQFITISLVSFEMHEKTIERIAGIIGLPSEIFHVVIVKMFSSSAASGLLIDLFKATGPDSYVSVLASIMMSSSETIFYTVSVYFGSVGIKKTRLILRRLLMHQGAGMNSELQGIIIM